MSKSAGQIIGGAIGAVVGYIYGGPQGAQIGWTIGSMVGGYVDPAKNFGPRLTDAAQQTAIDGVPITFGYGTFPTMGNVIWRSELREVKKKKRAGKGGSQVNITFTYLRSYAIGICEGPITGLLQVKKNGKIVYDARPDSDLISLGYTANQIAKIRVAQAKFLNNSTIYLGDETQMPDPTIESHEGVGNVAPFRGLAYLVVEEDDVTASSGAIAQYEFVVSACGTVETTGASSVIVPWLATAIFNNNGEMKYSPNGTDWTQDAERIDLGVGEWWAPDTRARMYRHELEILATTPSSSFGPVSMFSDDRGTTWRKLDIPGWDSASGEAVRSGNYWWLCSTSASINYVQRFNGVVVEGMGFSATTAMYFENRLITGAHANPSLFVRNPDTGILDETIQFNFTAQLTIQPRFAAGPSEGLITWVTTLPTPADARSHIAYITSTDIIQVTSPFPDITGGASTAEHIVFFDAPNSQWVVTFGRRVAFGPAANALILSSHVLPDIPTGIGSDGDKVIICGLNGMLEATPDQGATWQSLSMTNVSPGTRIQAVLALGENGIPAGATPIPDAPGWFIDFDNTIYGPGSESITRCRPVLAEVVGDLLQRIGLTPAEYDVTDLTDLLDGYRVHGEAGVDAMLAPLAQAYSFDITEYDGKVRCIKRGGDAVLSIGPDDFVESDGDAVQWERIQEAELLRKVTVAAFTPESGFSRSTQEAELRSATVQAKGESLFELAIVCSKDDLAKIADKQKKVAWSEPDKCKFALPYRLSSLTPADVIHIYDDDGNFRRIRLTETSDDTGIRYIEASLDRRSAYTSAAIGVSPPPPLIVDPPVVGPTTMAVVNIPAQNGAHDELGLYVAVAGQFSGWAGADIAYSADGGANYVEATTITEAATIGRTLTELLPEASSEYLSSQTLDVVLPDAPESVDYATLLRYFNRAALLLEDGRWEVLQYQTVTTIGDGQYRLSGLLRGRFATTPGKSAIGATFVLLDDSVQFVPVPTFLLGSSFLARATSTGTSPDAAIPQSVPFDYGASQTEWPPTFVQAARDSSDNVTVTWVGRGRIGTDVTPANSKYFTGYDVEVDDGSTVTVTRTTETQLVLNSQPDPISVRVAGVNSITGAGPYSEAITA